MVDIHKRLAQRAKYRTPSPIRELYRFMQIEGMISLGGGYPNPKTFVFDRMNLEFKGGKRISLERSELEAASQYGPSDAHPMLRKELVAWHYWKDKVKLNDSQLVVLNGSQEGLFIMAYLFLEKEDSVVVSEPTYPGAISAFKAFTNNFISVSIDEKGMVTEELEEVLHKIRRDSGRLPKFIYEIPNGHNPAGVSLYEERRRHLLEIAREFDLLVLEDDPYQLISLEDKPRLKTIQSLDEEGRVVRLDSFSKIFAPGLRLGYVSGSEEIIRQFVIFKQSSNLHTSIFIQEILYRYLRSHGYQTFAEHIHQNCKLYRRNREAMVEAAKKYLPPEVKYNVPREGMFIWFELPPKFQAKKMIEKYSQELKVLLVPGEAFSTRDGCKNCMRASFSLVTPSQIEEGIKRFGEMIRLERDSASPQI